MSKPEPETLISREDPVTLLETGACYERAAIEAKLQREGKTVSPPSSATACQEDMGESRVIPNGVIKHAIGDWKAKVQIMNVSTQQFGELLLRAQVRGGLQYGACGEVAKVQYFLS